MEEESYREKPVVLELKNIKKTFGDVAVLKGINLSVRAGEFLTFWGPRLWQDRPPYHRRSGNSG